MNALVRVGGFILAMLAAGELVVPWMAERGVLLLWPAITVVETGKTPEYIDLQPRSYPHPTSKAFYAAWQTIEALPGWRTVAANPERGVLKVEAVTWLFRFVYDITVTITPYEDRSVVYVRSASRIGQSDLGQNARNIRVFFKILDQKLTP